MNTDTDNDAIIDNDTGAYTVQRAELDGVRTSRIFAFFIDYLIVVLLWIPLALVVSVATIITVGFTWPLYAISASLVALLYVGYTMGGEHQSTIGMRMMGVKIKRLDGKQVDFVLAAVHGILFWAISTVGVFVPLLISFFSSKKRLLHDILLGTYVARI